MAYKAAQVTRRTASVAAIAENKAIALFNRRTPQAVKDSKKARSALMQRTGYELAKQARIEHDEDFDWISFKADFKEGLEQLSDKQVLVMLREFGLNDTQSIADAYNKQQQRARQRADSTPTTNHTYDESDDID